MQVIEDDEERHGGRGRFAYEVNGQVFLTDDRLLKGRDVRTGAGLDPAADWRLVQVMDRYTTSVGLEDRVELEAGVMPVFIAAQGDRDYDFTVNDLGWEWPAPTVAEADIRKYGRIAADRELVVEGLPGRALAHGGVLDLAGGGVERVFARKPQAPPPAPKRLKLVFIVGGEPHEVKAKAAETLRDVLARVLEETENVGRPVDDWQVTDVPGNSFDLGSTLEALGIHDGMELVASLKTGEAG